MKNLIMFLIGMNVMGIALGIAVLMTGNIGIGIMIIAINSFAFGMNIQNFI